MKNIKNVNTKKITLGVIGAFIISTSILQIQDVNEIEQDTEPVVTMVATTQDESKFFSNHKYEVDNDKQLLEKMMINREKPLNVASRAGRPRHLENNIEQDENVKTEQKTNEGLIENNINNSAINEESSKPKLTIEEVAKLTIDGVYGNGNERKVNLEKEGYDYKEVQSAIQNLMPKAKPKSTVETPVNKKSQSKPSIESEINSTNNQSNKNTVIQAYPHKTFKSYMSWTALSSSSPQGKLAAKSTSDSATAIMKINDRYLVALGFAYADYIGQEIDIVMKSGQVIPVIVGDWKAKAHTDQWNSASLNNGSIIEFIVSSNSEAAKATRGSGSYDSIFSGEVKEFRK